jgi:hypothetical protein
MLGLDPLDFPGVPGGRLSLSHATTNGTVDVWKGRVDSGVRSL